MAPTFFFEGAEDADGCGVEVGEDTVDVAVIDAELEVDVDTGAEVGVKFTPVYTTCKYKFEGCP
jgi:hypothetical protein